MLKQATTIHPTPSPLLMASEWVWMCAVSSCHTPHPPFSSPLPSRQTERKRMRKRADHLGRSLVTAFPLSLPSSRDATRCQSHTNTHTHSLRTDATGPDLATSFPWGNTRRHQLSGALLLCFPDLSSCLLPSPCQLLSPPLVIFYFHSFLTSSCILLIYYSFTSYRLSPKPLVPCYFILFFVFFYPFNS